MRDYSRTYGNVTDLPSIVAIMRHRTYPPYVHDMADMIERAMAAEVRRDEFEKRLRDQQLDELLKDRDHAVGLSGGPYTRAKTAGSERRATAPDTFHCRWRGRVT